MKKTIFFVASLAMGLLLVEIMIRVTPNSYRLRIARDRYLRDRAVMQTQFCEPDPDPLIGFRNRPGSRGVFENREFRHDVHINAWGMRGAEPRIPKPSRRFLVLGDSMTIGWGVGDEQTFAAQLSTLLPEWEFLNAGVPGYGTASEYGLLKRLGGKLHPSDVILVFYPNDPIETSFPARLEPAPVRRYNPPTPYFVDALRLALAKRQGSELPYPYYYGINQSMWATCSNYLTDIVSWCRQNRAKFLLVYMPLKDELRETSPVGYRKKVLEYCQEKGIACLDLTPAFQIPENPRFTHFNIDEHLTFIGHTVVARELHKRYNPGQ